MSPLDTYNTWKNKPFKKTNYDNIEAYYDRQKYIKMKPKSFIGLTPGFLHIIIKHPREWVQQNLKLEDEVTLYNETGKTIYYTIIDSLFFNEERDLKLHIKNGVLRS